MGWKRSTMPCCSTDRKDERCIDQIAWLAPGNPFSTASRSQRKSLVGRLEKIILVALVAVPAIAIVTSAVHEVSAVQKGVISIDVIISIIPPIIGPALSIFSSILAVSAVFSKQTKTATALLAAGIIIAIVAAIVYILTIGILAMGTQLLPPGIYAAGFALLVNIVALLGSILKNLDIRK